MGSPSTERVYEAEVYRRADGLFDWRTIAENGEIVYATAQGFTEANDAREAFVRHVRAIFTAAGIETGLVNRWTAKAVKAMLHEGVADAS